MKKLLEIVGFFTDGNEKGPETTFLIGVRRCRDFNLTNAGNSGLQVTPYRNYGSGLPKEAYIKHEQFPCQ